MKKRFFSAYLGVFVLLAAGHCRAGLLLGNFSLVTITTPQTNTAPLMTNSAYLTLPQATITNIALSATNSYQAVFRWSFDGINYFTNNSPSFYPTNTAAGNTVIPSQGISVPVVSELLFVTNSANTSTIQLGVTSP